MDHVQIKSLIEAYLLQAMNIINSRLLKRTVEGNKRIQQKRRSHYWKQKAYTDIKSIPEKGKLTKEQKTEIHSFFAPFVDCSTLFHEFYYAATGNYNVRYIPDDIYYTYIDTYFNNWDEAHFYDNKAYYDTLFPDVVQPRTVAVRCGGLWMSGERELLSIDDVLSRSSLLGGVFVKQATDSEGGHGVHYASNPKDIERAIQKIDGDIVIQEPLKQHDEMNKLNGTSVNTIRVLSLLSSEGVKIYSTVVRMGINGAKVDNASSGGITCGVNENGRLKSVAYSSSGTKYDKHPTSNIEFTSVVIPNYSTVLEMVRQLHKRLPHFKLVSWDIAIREDGIPVLIEVNIHYGELDFHQLNNGPVFGDDTEKILKEVFAASSNKER